MILLLHKEGMMNSETVIATRNLIKHFGNVEAIRGINLNVQRGEVYGFLGRNGAGKTTTIRMLLGLIQPTSGVVILLGKSVRPGTQKVFKQVGSLVEAATAYPNLTVYENLYLQRKIIGCPSENISEILSLLHLQKYSNRPAGKLSQGNKQRLSLARALLHKPEVLILDEPISNLDPAGIIEIRTLLRELVDNRDVTIFMSSHILAEVAHIADRIGIVHEGLLIEEVEYSEFQQRARNYLDLIVSDRENAQSILQERLNLQKIERLNEKVLRIFDINDRAPEIAHLLVNSGFQLYEMTHGVEDLEAHFMELTGGVS